MVHPKIWLYQFNYDLWRIMLLYCTFLKTCYCHDSPWNFTEYNSITWNVPCFLYMVSLYYNGILDIKKWYMNFRTMVYFKVHSATTGLLCKGYIHLKNSTMVLSCVFGHVSWKYTEVHVKNNNMVLPWQTKVVHRKPWSDYGTYWKNHAISLFHVYKTLHYSGILR